MHFVAIKNRDQQAVLMLHRAREILVRQRTMLINALRAHLAEFGHVSAQGARNIREVLNALEADQIDIPVVGRSALVSLGRQLDGLEQEICKLDCDIKDWHRQSAVSQRLATIPGVGIITATALAATVADPSLFKSARQFAAWLGLFPRQNSSGGKYRLGRITKMGDRYLRKLLFVGATAVLRHAARNNRKPNSGLSECLSKNQSDWSMSLWPTRRHGSSGLSCQPRRTISLREILGR